MSTLRAFRACVSQTSAMAKYLFCLVMLTIVAVLALAR